MPTDDFEIRFDEAELAKLLTDLNGPVADHLRHLGVIGAQESRRLAPVSPEGPARVPGAAGRPPGWLRSHIYAVVDRDTEGLYLEIGCDARTKDGHNYALDVELGTKPHTIRSHGDYPLRDHFSGRVFGREVHHPGTTAQPFLRPVLDFLRRAD